MGELCPLTFKKITSIISISCRPARCKCISFLELSHKYIFFIIIIIIIIIIIVVVVVVVVVVLLLSM